MTSQPRLPVLPHGSPTTLSALSETFSFHSSPESFITSRVLAFQVANPTLADSRTPIRAKVLNRNVAVISSYDHAKQILCDEGILSKISAGKAYDELMAPFFSPPNLLLADFPDHKPMKDVWRNRIASLPADCQLMFEQAVVTHFKNIPSNSTIDLYESMKLLSWTLLLRMFLSASNDHHQNAEDAATIEGLQEDLLRGQFSLFPVSINTRFWRSPRAKGLAARKELQALLKDRVRVPSKGCPFATKDSIEDADVANHLLLFTSSLAVKSLASLLTAVMLNLYVYSDSASTSGSESIAYKFSSPERSKDSGGDELLRSIILETERLSPPVVGIMRRTVQDITLPSQHDHVQPTLIPKGWDIWLYFVGASRDPAALADHGGSPDLFHPDRHYSSTGESGIAPQPSLAFGAGPKTCLGEDLIREIVTTVAKTCLGTNFINANSKPMIELQRDGNDLPTGVQAWLGWQKDVKSEDWARDMKQLPTQRPVKPVMVNVVHSLNNEA